MKAKTFFRYTFLPFFSFFIIASLVHFAHADTGYTLLEPLPTLNGNNSPDLVQYLTAVYELVIGFAGILAVLMIVIAGLEYIFAALPSTKSDAKNRIIGAISGLLLILVSIILLQAINPQLTEKGFLLSDVGGSSGGGTPPPGGGGTPPPGGGNGNPEHPTQEEFEQGEAAVRQQLQAVQVSINKGPCATAYTNGVTPPGCTNVFGYDRSGMVTLLGTLKAACDAAKGHCNVVITGGTEGGHSTHGLESDGETAKNVVDLRSNDDAVNFRNYIESGTPSTLYGYPSFIINNLNCWHEVSGGTADHFHCAAT
jgi:hypothetical protein